VKKTLLIVILLISISYATTIPSHVVHMNNGDIHVVKLIETTSTFFIVENADGENIVIPIIDVKMIKKIGSEDPKELQSRIPEPEAQFNDTKPTPNIPNENNALPQKIEVEEDVKKNIRRVSIGLAMPQTPNDFKDYWNKGVNFSFEQVTKLQEGFHIGFEVAYSVFALDEAKLKDDFGGSDDIRISGGDVSIFTLMVRFKSEILPPPEPSFYVHLGFGFYTLSASDVTISDPYRREKYYLSSENAFAINPGIGILIPIQNSRANFCIEGSYQIAFTESDITSHIPIKVGLAFR